MPFGHIVPSGIRRFARSRPDLRWQPICAFRMNGQHKVVSMSITRRAVVQSVVVTLAAYVLASALEAAVIRWLRPSEWELAWVSDLALASALGVAVFFWRRLVAVRQELGDRQRAEIVIQTQLSVAAQIQRQLLPSLPPAINGCEWAAALRPAGKIGGDFYDFVETAPGVWILLIADVSGKGIPAALALGSLRSTFRALATQHLGPAQILARLSSAFLADWSGTPYLTCIVATLNVRACSIVYSNAGHPPAILAGPTGTRHLARGGPPAGLIGGTGYAEETLALVAGDTCVLVSDGVTEALDGVSLEQTLLLANEHDATASQICERLMAKALAGRGPGGDPDWDDDRTVVVMTFESKRARRDEASARLAAPSTGATLPLLTPAG
jgi:hypothetical protein